MHHMKKICGFTFLVYQKLCSKTMKFYLWTWWVLTPTHNTIDASQYIPNSMIKVTKKINWLRSTPIFYQNFQTSLSINCSQWLIWLIHFNSCYALCYRQLGYYDNDYYYVTRFNTPWKRCPCSMHILHPRLWLAYSNFRIQKENRFSYFKLQPSAESHNFLKYWPYRILYQIP